MDFSENSKTGRVRVVQSNQLASNSTRYVKHDFLKHNFIEKQNRCCLKDAGDKEIFFLFILFFL